MGSPIRLRALHGPCRRVTKTFLVAVFVYGVKDAFGRAGANVDFVVAETHLSVTAVRRGPDGWARIITLHGRGYGYRGDSGGDEEG
jgi:hypothetical protein